MSKKLLFQVVLISLVYFNGILTQDDPGNEETEITDKFVMRAVVEVQFSNDVIVIVIK